MTETPPYLKLPCEHLEYIARFMASADVRYYLNGINVRPHPDGGVAIAATDGHALIVHREREGQCSGEMTLQLRPATLAAAKAKPATKTLQLHGNRLTVHQGHDEIFVQAGDPIIGGRYPDVFEQLRRYPENELKPGLIGSYNMPYLLRLLQPKARSRNPFGTFYTHSRWDPVVKPNQYDVRTLLFFPDFMRGAVVVIMSVRTDHDGKFPEWLATMPGAPPVVSETDTLRAALADLIANVRTSHYATEDQLHLMAPWHSHGVPGIWDGDDEHEAGAICQECKAWAEAVVLAEKTEIPKADEALAPQQ